jgi:hypothetical protein
MTDAANPDGLLPAELLEGATLRGNEYGWRPECFPNALAIAEVSGYACIGGQFEFRLVDGTYEMYWLAADASNRVDEESWSDYCQRSCGEVRKRFERLMQGTDFRGQVSEFQSLKARMIAGFDPLSTLVFVAYFVGEGEGAS